MWCIWKAIDKFDEIEKYFTPNYLYEIDPKNEIFKIINNKKEDQSYFFIKEHIFYYQFLIKCLKDEKNKKKVNKAEISEIFYRTLLNRLYILYSDPKPRINYGISEVFNLTCIYSIIEADIVNQIINMKKFDHKLLDIPENEIRKLFGTNDEIDKARFYI